MEHVMAYHFVAALKIPALQMTERLTTNPIPAGAEMEWVTSGWMNTMRI